MADNISITPGSGAVVATETSADGTSQLQRVKIVIGSKDVDAGNVSSSNGMPVTSPAYLEQDVGINEQPSGGTFGASQERPFATFLTADPDGDLAGVNILEQLVNSGSDLSLNVNITNPTIKPPADGVPFNIYGSAAAPVNVFDTTGYQSLVFQVFAAITITPTISNDGQTFVGTVCFPMTSSLVGAATNGAVAGIFVVPVTARFMRLAFSAFGTVSVMFRTLPFNPALGSLVTNANTQTLAGTTVVTAGLAGVQAIGGNIAAGVAPTANPVLTGGIDSGGLTRRVLTDTSGRVQVGDTWVDPSSVQRQPNLVVGIPSTAAAQSAYVVPVQENSQVEGLNVIQLLGLILTELRTLNFQIYQLPMLQNAGLSSSDEPAMFAADPTNMLNS